MSPKDLIVLYAPDALVSLLNMWVLILAARCYRGRRGVWGVALVFQGTMVFTDVATWGCIAAQHSTWNLLILTDLLRQFAGVFLLGKCLLRRFPIDPARAFKLPVLGYLGLGAVALTLARGDWAVARCVLASMMFAGSLGLLVSLAFWEELTDADVPLHHTELFWLTTSLVVQYAGQVALANVVHLADLRGPIPMYWIYFAVCPIPQGLSALYLLLATRKTLYE